MGRDIDELSPADRMVLAFLAEHRVGIEPQLGSLLGVSTGAAERRVRRLAGRGLVGRRTIFAQAPATTWITRAGLRAIGSRLPAPSLDAKGYRHDIGVGWLWLAAHTGMFGELRGAVSERHMRSADARLGRPSAEPDQTRPHGVGIGGVGPTGLPQRHYPDLLLALASGRTLALELELSSKGPRRLTGIMRGYAGDPRIDSVLYLVANRRIGGAIELAAREAGVSHLVHVQPLAGDQAIAGAPAGGLRLAGGRSAASAGRGAGARRARAAEPGR